jgi:hypothetical protein
MYVGRKSAMIKGDFVVFLIGSRINRSYPLTPDFAQVGKYMDEIKKELDDNPDLGCLGTESYVGECEEGSTSLLVQYWSSVEALERNAQSASNKHHHPWLFLMKLGRETDKIGFWHETFQVREGEYEAIYVNCPKLHLGNCEGVQVVAASSKYTTMKGRLGKGQGNPEEWPEGFKVHSGY